MGNFGQVLPLEIRRQIYRELLLAKQELAPPKCPSESVGPSQLHPAILRINKQTYYEASTILYEENHFYCNSTMNDNVLDMPFDVLLGKQCSLNLLDRVKHVGDHDLGLPAHNSPQACSDIQAQVRLIFHDHSLSGLYSMLDNIVDCELQTLSLVFVVMSVDTGETRELGRPEIDSYRADDIATEMFILRTTLPAIREKTFKEYAINAVRNVGTRLDISVQTDQEKLCKPVEEFATAIETAKGWTSVLTNSEFLPEKKKSQHRAGVLRLTFHAPKTQMKTPQGIWKRTWTLKPSSKIAVENASSQVTD